MHVAKITGSLTIFLAILSVAMTGVSRDWKVSCPRLPDDSVQAQLSAGQLFDAAEKHYRAGRPVEALTSFLCSFQIVQHENTVFNIAQIAKLSQNRDVYLDLLKDFVANTNGRVKVDPIREIIAELDSSYKNESSDSPLKAGPPDEKVAAALPESDPAENGPPSVEAAAEKKRRSMKVAGWAVFGAGAASAAVGGVLQGLSASAQQDAATQDTLTGFTTAESKMKNFQVGAIAGFATGGALIATGLVLVLLSDKTHESKTVSVIPTVGGLAVTGRFY